MKKNDPEQRHHRCRMLRKITNIMKLTALLFFMALFQVSAISYSQTRLSLKFEKETLEAVFSKIEANSEFSIFYKNELIRDSKEVSGEYKNASVNEILDQVLKSEDLTYTVRGKLIMIVPKTEGLQEDNAPQQKSISGKVIDSTGAPLPGVSVVVKGTTNGTITDGSGNYSLTNVPESATLQFSFVGMKLQEIVVDGKSTVNATLEEETVGIEEVVAIGYGTQKKVNLTGAISTVNGADMIKRPVTNAASMLQGNLSGVQITQNSGEPGNESISIRIRGTGTFSSAGSDPLVLVDGVQGKLSDLNPNNIESISVLKDAASASIYGSRAANGVILVTTKVGKEGKVSMEYSGNFGIHTPTKMYDLITNSAEYMELFNEAKINSGFTTGLYTQDMINSYRNATDRNLYPNTDWLDLVFSPAPTQTHNLSFSGGSKTTKFDVSLGYVNQRGGL